MPDETTSRGKKLAEQSEKVRIKTERLLMKRLGDEANGDSSGDSGTGDQSTE